MESFYGESQLLYAKKIKSGKLKSDNKYPFAAGIVRLLGFLDLLLCAGRVLLAAASRTEDPREDKEALCCKRQYRNNLRGDRMG